MAAPGYLTVLAAVVVAAVLVASLVAIAGVLVDVDRQLGAVIDVVGAIVTSTAPVPDVVGAIAGDLGEAQRGLTTLLERKAGGAAAAADLVASVDPLARSAPEPTSNGATAPVAVPTAAPPRPAPRRPVVPAGRRGGFRFPSDWQQ